MGLKKNIIYSSVLTTSNYIFPLIVYPYVSRVLGVSNIGICNFIDGIIHYFILFSMMGVTIMGTREIAASRNNSDLLERRYSSILALNGITTFIAVMGLLIATVLVPELWENRKMMLYGGVKLLSSYLLIEWFYKGIEEFRYITVRTIFVKLLYVISVFIFVRQSDDYSIYYLLTCLMVTGNAVINFIHAHKYVKFRFYLISIKDYLKPFFTLGSYMLITSMCTTFNVVYLGFLTNDTQVGYYTTATKLYTILLALFTGVTSVILPRMSSLLAENRMNEYVSLLKKSTSVLFSFSIPAIIFVIIFAQQIVLTLSGPGYEGAIMPMRIVIPLMLIIGYEQIIVIQGLMPLRKDKEVMINSTVGACVSVILNYLLVSRLQSIGSAIVWVCSEFVILILSQIVLTRNIHISFPFKAFIKNCLGYLPLAIILLILTRLMSNVNYIIALLISGIVMVVYTLLLQICLLKNTIIINFIHSILHRK